VSKTIISLHILFSCSLYVQDSTSYWIFKATLASCKWAGFRSVSVAVAYNRCQHQDFIIPSKEHFLGLKNSPSLPLYYTEEPQCSFLPVNESSWGHLYPRWSRNPDSQWWVSWCIPRVFIIALQTYCTPLMAVCSCRDSIICWGIRNQLLNDQQTPSKLWEILLILWW